MTNFDFLKNEPKFKDFADVAISAERIFQLDYAASVLKDVYKRQGMRKVKV